jgi:acetyl-CoA acyltransferase
MAREVVVLDVLRTPFTRGVKGLFRNTRPDTLAAEVVKALLARYPQLTPSEIDDVIVGIAMPEAEQGMNAARLIGLLAGLPAEVPAMTVNRFCSSGSQTFGLAADRIALGYSDLALAGGTESMSMIPMGGNKVSASPELMESCPEAYTPMGTTAENVATRFEVARADQDAFALRSHQRALAAQAAGYLGEEIIPISTTVLEAGGPQAITVDKDECPRADTTLDGLSKLRPAFNPKGSVTAGNSSPLTDGAAMGLLASAEKAEALGIKPLGTFHAWAVAGVAPDIMGIGPVPAVRKLLAKTGLSLKDIDVIELNEAFAAQGLYCMRELGLDPDKVNPNGGAIAIGHPLGATGARQIGAALRHLRRTGGRYGIVTMCIGGGMGFACLVEAKP